MRNLQHPLNHSQYWRAKPLAFRSGHCCCLWLSLGVLFRGVNSETGVRSISGVTLNKGHVNIYDIPALKRTTRLGFTSPNHTQTHFRSHTLTLCGEYTAEICDARRWHQTTKSQYTSDIESIAITVHMRRKRRQRRRFCGCDWNGDDSRFYAENEWGGGIEQNLDVNAGAHDVVLRSLSAWIFRLPRLPSRGHLCSLSLHSFTVCYLSIWVEADTEVGH